jgi:hypothetical protein
MNQVLRMAVGPRSAGYGPDCAAMGDGCLHESGRNVAIGSLRAGRGNQFSREAQPTNRGQTIYSFVFAP